MRPTHSPVLLRCVAGVVATVAALGACGGDDTDDSDASTPRPTAPAATDPVTTAPSTAPTSTTAPTTTPPTTTNAPTTTAPTTTAPTTTAAPAAPTCLVGEWVVTEAELNAFYDAVEARIDQPIEFTISGDAGLVFTDTTYAWSPAFSVQLDLAGAVGSGDAGGSITGTYTADGGVLSTAVTESAMTLTIDIAGQTIDGSELGNGFITSVPFASSPYSCEGPAPVIQFETVDDRHPVTLSPAG